MVYDAIVVGSGPGGGIAAYALAAQGLQVALVEGGRRLTVGKDYGRDLPPLDLLERRLAENRPGAFDSAWDFREQNHFTPVGDRPGHGLVRALGGRSLCWAGHTLRFGPIDYRQWPISYEEVAPYYSRAERFMGVYGYKDGLKNLPDGEFLAPVPMRAAESLLRRGVNRLKAQGQEMDFIALRKAMATVKHSSGRAVCQYCGNCGGCPIDSKYTSANTPIPAGLKTGRLKVFTNATMTRILMGREANRVAGIEYVNATGSTEKPEKLECRTLVLACSAIETARMLLANATREFPNGLANSSGQVGRNLTSHFGVTVIGTFAELKKRSAANDAGTGYYHSLLTGMYWERPSTKFEGTYQVQCGAGFPPQRLPVRNVKGFGAKFKEELREANVTHAGMNMQGSLLVSGRKFIDLDPERKDRNGVPLPRVHLHYEDSDIAMAQDMVDRSEEIIRAGGGKVLSSPGKVRQEDLVIDLNHWVGTTKMGRDARSSVVNTSSQSHDVPNLFIGDASVFPAYPEKNPTLTNIALSWRMAEKLADKLRRKEI
jgi:choline dehydrogenase-like flavoprotein